MATKQQALETIRSWQNTAGRRLYVTEMRKNLSAEQLAYWKGFFEGMEKAVEAFEE